MFDKNNDGFFSPMEFECAFTVLNIDFKKADLRKLMEVTDTNKDGKVSHSEFIHMLDHDPNMKKAVDNEAIQEVSEYDSDESPQKQSFAAKAAGS
jgi:Ca2+-binding EF-hand superfamily protein